MRHAELQRGHRPKNSNCNIWDFATYINDIQYFDETSFYTPFGVTLFGTPTGWASG